MGQTEKKKKARDFGFPTVGQVEAELQRVRYRKRYKAVLRSTLFTLITVAAVAVLVATLWMPVLQIYGESMTPTLEEGEIVVSVKTNDLKPGDIIAFHYNSNKILVKRYIAGPGDWVSIDDAGVVTVNDEELDEPYISEHALGECDLEFPVQVPEKRFFVMGDHRSTSVDSRTAAVGYVAEEQIVGKIVFCVWPFSEFGKVN